MIEKFEDKVAEQARRAKEEEEEQEQDVNLEKQLERQREEEEGEQEKGVQSAKEKYKPRRKMFKHSGQSTEEYQTIKQKQLSEERQNYSHKDYLFMLNQSQGPDNDYRITKDCLKRKALPDDTPLHSITKSVNKQEEKNEPPQEYVPPAVMEEQEVNPVGGDENLLRMMSM